MTCMNFSKLHNHAGRRAQRGASLLEGIAYLGIAAIVILGAVSLLTGAFSSAQSNRGAEEVVSIRTGVKKLYMGRSGAYDGELTASLNTAKIFPATLTPKDATGAAMINGWGGDVTVKGAASKSTFIIAYTSVPQDACISMVSGASGWTRVVSDSSETNVFPITPATGATLCGRSSNKLEFESY